MDKNMVVAIVLGALVIVAAIQAFQLFGLKSKLASETATVGQPMAASGGSGGGVQVPSNPQNLPSMVGGC